MKLALALLLLAVTASHAAARDVSYAITIGNNAPPATGMPTLHYADDDAVRYYQLFGRITDHTHLLAVLDAPTQRRYPELGARAQLPTLANLTGVVADYAERMAADIRRGDRPILYVTFSGHGAAGADGTPYLALLDGQLTRERLYGDVIGKLPAAYVHLIVDACNAGAVVGVRGPVELESRAVELTLPERLAVAQGEQRTWPTVGVVLAATAGQEAHEWSQIEAGVFSHEVLSGLLGAADSNRDGQIEYSELAAFISSANRDIADPRAAPQVIARPPASDRHAPLLALAALRGAIYLTGDAAAIGHFYVELPNGQRYLDAHLAPGAALRVALPAATRIYVRTSTTEAEIPARATGNIALGDLQFHAAAIQGRGSVDVAYRLGLFRHAYSEAYYAGYVDSAGLPSVSFAPSPTGTVRIERAELTIGPEPAAPSHKLALGLAITGGVAGITAIVSGVYAYDAWRDYRDTQIQRDAHDATGRYHRNVAISITSGVIAAGAAVASYWLWPARGAQITATVDSRAATIGVTARF